MKDESKRWLQAGIILSKDPNGGIIKSMPIKDFTDIISGIVYKIK